MLVIPAIDLKDGACVRLKQGRMSDSTVFSDSPVETAAKWVQAGCRRLHLVDLNGAFAGEPVNGDAVKAIASTFTDLPIQIGGGIRSLHTIEAYLNAGVSQVIIGTAAIEDPQFVREACRQFGGAIYVGVDANDGLVATRGWAEQTQVQATDLVADLADAGVSAVIYTDIARDGMMQGVNVEQTLALANSTNIDIIASGGVTNMADIEQLAAVADQGIMGAITGRAIYEGSLDLASAQAYCDQVAGAL